MPRDTPGKWRKKQEIEADKQKPKVLNRFEINCISSPLGDPEL
jgi:hypothetical protein